MADLPKRVLIVGPGHPWKGHEAKVLGTVVLESGRLALRVRLDRGKHAGKEIDVVAGEWRKAPDVP